MAGIHHEDAAIITILTALSRMEVDISEHLSEKRQVGKIANA